jgi:hypothetical protein
MNNLYPEWWNTTITVFNKFTDPQTKVVRWYKTVVNGAFWKYVGDKIMIGKTVLETNNTICRIRKDIRFLEKYQWLQKPNDEMSNYFTLAKGDILIKGEVDDEIDEYTAGKRSNDIIAKYKQLQGCMTIEEIAINVGAGRCNEHYYVKGV